MECIPTWITYSNGNSFAHEILPVEEALNTNNYKEVEDRLKKSMEDTLLH